MTAIASLNARREFPTTADPANSASAEAPNILFPVAMKRFSVDGIDAGDFRAVVRTDTGETLGITKKSYRLFSNDEIIPYFEKALYNSKANLEGLQVVDKLVGRGEITMREYYLPGHQIEVRHDDKVDLRIRLLNAYDGHHKLAFWLGGFRLLCSNGMVVGQKMSHIVGRHTKNFDIGQAVKQLDSALNFYVSESKKWDRWANLTLDDDQALEIICKLPEAGPKLCEKIHGYWHNESAKLGPNLWALYNALTYWSTHEEVKARDKQAGIIVLREQRVMKLMRTEVFRKLAA